MYFDYLWRMLQPLGVYSGEGYNGGELKALGAALDSAQELLGEYFRESKVETAESTGLEKSEALFPMMTATATESRRAALETLFQTDNLCCSAEALEKTLEACGIYATVGEMGTQFQVIVGLTELLVIEKDPVFQFWLLEQLMPCHLVTIVVFQYEDVESGEIVHERMTLSLARQRTQSEWEQRLGAYV